MVRLGIDIGLYKTVMYTSKNNGTIVPDDTGAREFPTVVELTLPKRKFGKKASSDNSREIEVRHRNLMSNLHDKDGRMILFMYFKYLNRVLNNTNYISGVLTIPETFGQKERIVLKSLTDSTGLKIEEFITDQTAASANFAVYNFKKIPEYVIVDFGASKTTIGFYKVVENQLIPVSRDVINYGAVQLDNILTELIISKYNLNNSKVIRERIYQSLLSIKKGLNSLEGTNTNIYDENYKRVSINVTREEFLSKADKVLKKMQDFIDKNLKGIKAHIEVVGKNFQNEFVRALMSEYNYNIASKASEVVAIGSALFAGINSQYDMKFKFREILGSDVYLKINNSTELEQVFEKSSLIGDVKQFKLVVNDVVNISIISDKNYCLGDLVINKPDKESEMNINLVVNKFGIPEIKNIELVCDEKTSSYSDYIFNYIDQCSKEELDEINNIESKFDESENNFKKAGEIRNNFETILNSLVDWFIENFYDHPLSNEEKELIYDVSNDYFDLEATGDFEKETSAIKSARDRLEFVTKKLKAIEHVIKDDLDKLREDIREFVKVNSKNTKSVLLLKGIDNKISKMASKLKLSFDSVKDFSIISVKSFKEEIDVLKEKAKVEIEEEKERERKKEEELKIKEGIGRAHV